MAEDAAAAPLAKKQDVVTSRKPSPSGGGFFLTIEKIGKLRDRGIQELKSGKAEYAKSARL